MGIKEIQGNVNITENLTINGNIPFIAVQNRQDINLDTVLDGTIFYDTTEREFLRIVNGEITHYSSLEYPTVCNIGYNQFDYNDQAECLKFDLSSQEEYSYDDFDSADFIIISKLVKKGNSVC